MGSDIKTYMFKKLVKCAGEEKAKQNEANLCEPHPVVTLNRSG